MFTMGQRLGLGKRCGSRGREARQRGPIITIQRPIRTTTLQSILSQTRFPSRRGVTCPAGRSGSATGVRSAHAPRCTQPWSPRWPEIRKAGTSGGLRKFRGIHRGGHLAVILTWRRLGNLGPAFRLLAQGQERREVFLLCGLVERGKVAQERAATDRVAERHLGLLEQAGLFLVTESPPTVAPQDQDSGEQVSSGPVFLVQPLNVIAAARPGDFRVEEGFLEQNMGTGCTIQF